jgi:hypothetical protein
MEIGFWFPSEAAGLILGSFSKGKLVGQIL